MSDIKETRTLTLEGALKVLNAAIAEATRIGQPMCIAVVTPSGDLVYFVKMDDCQYASIAIAQTALGNTKANVIRDGLGVFSSVGNEIQNMLDGIQAGPSFVV